MIERPKDLRPVPRFRAEMWNGLRRDDFDELLAESDIEVFSAEEIMARIKRAFE